MHIHERVEGDMQRLQLLVRTTAAAKQRDRYRAVVLALGKQDAVTIAAQVGRSRRFVQDWVYAYRDGGIDAIGDKPRSGRPPMLDAAAQVKFKQRMLAGPQPDADGGRCTLRGQDAARILRDEFNTPMSLSNAYDLLHRLGLSCLKPRPHFRGHRKNDPQAMAAFVERAPFLSKK
jgi:transposase